MELSMLVPLADNERIFAPRGFSGDYVEINKSDNGLMSVERIYGDNRVNRVLHVRSNYRIPLH